MTPIEAAKILGTTPEAVRMWQDKGIMPRPIPDDFLNPFIEFRVRLNEAFRRKIDKERAAEAGDGQ